MSPNGCDPYEARLVERFRQGDRRALDSLFEMHVDRVYSYARHIVGSREDAEEVASEAFMKAFRHALDFRGDCAFRGWLFGIARNLCRDRLRQPRLIVMPQLETDQVGDDPADRIAIRTDVRKAMASLPEEYREILTLCDVEEWDSKEAARMIERSHVATRSLLYRARRALRDKLAEQWREN